MTAAASNVPSRCGSAWRIAGARADVAQFEGDDATADENDRAGSTGSISTSYLRCSAPAAAAATGLAAIGSLKLPLPLARVHSEAPQRVLMTKPSSVENPIVVATLGPASMAHRLALLPRWARIARPPAVGPQRLRSFEAMWL